MQLSEPSYMTVAPASSRVPTVFASSSRSITSSCTMRPSMETVAPALETIPVGLSASRSPDTVHRGRPVQMNVWYPRS